MNEQAAPGPDQDRSHGSKNQRGDSEGQAQSSLQQENGTNDDRHQDNKVIDIFIISICAVIADADSSEDIEEFAISRIEWFKFFLERPNGIPSHDIFARVFSRLDP